MISSLRITEIFYSLQGETRTVGLPTVFIRLTGCPLRCHYCDTAYAFSGGTLMSLPAILEQVALYHSHYITVTGGEPLAQPACFVLLQLLCDQGYEVSLETSGALDVGQIDPRVIKVIDLKTPGSGESHRNLYSNLDHLNPHDQIKFVITDRVDYEWSCMTLKNYQLSERCDVLFSPSHEQLSAVDLAEWILADRLCVRFQLQLHKILWGNKPGH